MAQLLQVLPWTRALAAAGNPLAQHALGPLQTYRPRNSGGGVSMCFPRSPCPHVIREPLLSVLLKTLHYVGHPVCHSFVSITESDPV